MSDQKILVVDDEEHIRRLCAEVLQQDNYSVLCFSNALEALRAASQEPFDLLLTDINMPEMDGLELVQAIKEIQKDITAVVMTGFGTVDNVIQCLHLGAHGFLVKPFSYFELIRSIKEALNRNRIVRENMRVRLLLPLFEVGKSLLTELNLENLLNKVTQVAMEETRSDAVSVLLLNDEKKLVLKSHKYSRKPYSDAVFRGIIGALNEWTSGRNKDDLLENQSRLQHEMQKVIGGRGLSTMAFMPLVSKENIVGFLTLCKREGSLPYAQSELDLISILCGQAAIAIENAKLFNEVETKNKELGDFYFESVKALAQAIEAKDSVTGSHSDRLGNYALAIGERVGLSDDECSWLRYAAALHDIGKIAVSESVLRKPGKLSPQEYDEMKTHPARGGEILREVKFLTPVVPIIYYHHEQYNGNGYPEGLKGTDIPIGSRIVAVLDAFDAMTSDRPYRKKMPGESAVSELRRYSGIQFDGKIVEAFVQSVQYGP